MITLYPFLGSPPTHHDPLSTPHLLQALAHPYLGSLHDSSDEPLARTAF